MGRAFATRFTAAGHHVTITATDAAQAAQAAAAAGPTARAVPAAEIGAADWPFHELLSERTDSAL